MLGNAVLLQHVRRLAATASSDEQLLADFLARRSDDAFSALIGRHGPMVLNVCRRILHDSHLAEDVFQATFLVLADRAGAIHRRASLAGFLHGVAYRLAVRARRRSTSPLPADVCDRTVGPPAELAWKEMLGILDDELSRLSDRYRAPLVLCYLEGRTQDEAARQLGWGLNTLRRRLAEGRRLLESRLRGRGVSLSSALAGVLAGGAALVPGDLRAATSAAVLARAAGEIASATSIFPPPRKSLGFLLSATGRKLCALAVVTALASVICLLCCRVPQADQAAAGEPTPAGPANREGPAEAAVRLGTARYRLGTPIQSMAVSPDGKLAAVTPGWRSFAPARVFDLTDGRCLYSLPHGYERGIEAVGLSPDGKSLAAKDNRFVYFLDAATGKEIRKLKYFPETGGSRSMPDWLTFSPDGKQVAVTLMGEAVCLVDVGTAEVVRTFEHGAAASACVFSPDGKRLATAGYEQDKGVYFARIWEVGTGKELTRFPAARFPTGNGGKRTLVFSPDGALLASGGWGDARLRLWETATGKERTEFPKLGEEIESVAFTPDGKTVAAAADKIYLYDPVTGKDRLRIEKRARGLAFNSDGSVLTGAVSGAIYRWDTTTGRQLTPAAGQDSGVEQILISPDGRSVFTTDQEANLYIWDNGSSKSPHRIAEGIDRGFVASPDGRLLAWTGKGVYGGSRALLYDVKGERLLDRFPSFGDDATVAAFLPDGKTLLTLGRGNEPAVVRLWDVESGKERRSFAAVPSAKVPARGNSGVPFFTTRTAALSPDGKTLAVGTDWEENLSTGRDQPVRLWDVATGKAGHELTRTADVLDPAEEAGTGKVSDLGLIRVNRKMKSAGGLAFSPDGRLLVDWAENPIGRSRMDHVDVWDVASGRLVTSLVAGPRPGAANAAFAPDGRTFATASADGVIRLWEVATWKVRVEFRGHRDQVTALAFGPDGRLFTGGLDTVVLGWDVRPGRDAAKGTIADAWEGLLSADGKAAFAAQGRFLAEPDRAVEWLASRVTPVRAPEAGRVKALIADLDSDDFSTRSKATEELREYGPLVAGALREAVAKPASLEARRRAEGLLREVEGGVIPPRERRALRAVEVLEWIGTKEARARLSELAKGAAESYLTRDAAAACKRVEGRK